MGDKTKKEDEVKDNDQTVDLSALALSDEDFDKINEVDILSDEPLETLPVEADAETKAEDEDEATAEDESEGDSESEGDTKSEENKEDTKSDDDSEDQSSEDDDDVDSDDKDDDKDSDDKEEEDKDKSDDEDVAKDKDDKTLDAAAQLAELYKPFRANGRDMQVDNVVDARTLMQMGANYNKKMQGLKPNLKLIKMLDNNDLLDEGKLTYLIDLSKKNPDAIKKLVKESGLDPLEFGEDKTESEYKPDNTYTVDDEEVELDNVVNELKDSPSFKTTFDVISNKWDAPSKRAVLENPNILKVINEHVERGYYDKIAEAVERGQILGKLNGMTDLEAYQHVGNILNEAGAFNEPTDKKDNVTDIDKNADAKTVTKEADKKRQNLRKSASSTKKTTSNKKVEDAFNPLSLSDEEFEKKLASAKFV